MGECNVCNVCHCVHWGRGLLCRGGGGGGCAKGGVQGCVTKVCVRGMCVQGMYPGVVCSEGGVSRGSAYLPPQDTPIYGQPLVATHPYGMHSFSNKGWL